MKRPSQRAADAVVETAIDRVLAAEQAARESIAALERECAKRLDTARARARAIDERAERRIRVARERFEANVAREVQAIRDEASSLDMRHALTEEESRQVREAVATLASMLTGGGK